MKRVMKGWALVSGCCTFLCLLLWHGTKQDILLTAAITAGTIFYHIGIRLVIGYAFDVLLRNQTNYQRKWYRVSPWEKRLYNKLKVKGWKQKMPTYDTALFDPSLHTWEEIAKAMCQAELVHETNIVASFVPLLFSIWLGAFPVFLVTSLLAAGYDGLFVMLQRYNRPRVLRLAERKTHRLCGEERKIPDEKV